jgi:hypothetical protein
MYHVRVPRYRFRYSLKIERTTHFGLRKVAQAPPGVLVQTLVKTKENGSHENLTFLEETDLETNGDLSAFHMQTSETVRQLSQSVT